MTASIFIAIFTIAVLGVTIWQLRGLQISVYMLCLCALTCAATLVLSYFYIPIPTGSAISPMSMLPIALLSLIYDRRAAFLTGFAAAILALFFLPGWQPVHWAQFFVEHLVCFTSLGYASIFGTDRRWKITVGTLLAVALRVMGHIFSGYLFFNQNAWAGYGPWAYTILYNLSGAGVEAILTVAIVTALPIRQMRHAVRKESGHHE